MMKALAVILLLISTTFQEVAKSKDGILKASVKEIGEQHLISINTTNLLASDSLFVHTNNKWKIKLAKTVKQSNGEDQYIINSVQASVLLEDEVIAYTLYSNGQKYEYYSTDRGYLKNHIKKAKIAITQY